MNQKLIAILYIILLSIGTIVNLYIPKTEAAVQDTVVIPKEAIRLRILANSDHAKDQQLKREVRDAVNAQITEWVGELTSLDDARSLLQGNLVELQRIAENVVQENNEDQTVKVEFGKVQFPTKLYGNFLYPAGEYEAILITLGKGEGANWWCVLFPPLCFLDFANGVAVSDGFEEEDNTTEKEQTVANEVKQEPSVFVEDKEEEVKVKFFIVELWNKIKKG